MRAWNVPRAGAEVWPSDLPVPEVTEGTTLVRAPAAAPNAIDSALAARTMTPMIPHRYPLVLAVTPPGPPRRQARVTSAAPGHATIGHTLLAQPVRPGTPGEYALLPAAAVTAKPAGPDFTTATAIPLAGMAALAAVDAIGAKPGQVVLAVG